ncbi:MAG: hypothetical protein ACREJU_04045, partial [Nitrospiraceae bacterium]
MDRRVSLQMPDQCQQTILRAFREVADLLVSIRERSEQLKRQADRRPTGRCALSERIGDRDTLDAQRTVLAAQTQLLQTTLTDLVSLFKILGEDGNLRALRLNRRPDHRGHMLCGLKRLKDRELSRGWF